MKPKRLLPLLLIFIICCKTAKNEPIKTTPKKEVVTYVHNLNFEKQSYSPYYPKGWWKWGGTKGYEIIKDTVTTYDGKYAIKLIGKKDVERSDFFSPVYKFEIPKQGKEVTLTGYIKTKDVTDGNAFIMLKLKGKNELWQKKITSEKINGTNDWKQYSVKIPFVAGKEFIYLSCRLTGSGTAWFDALDVKIDGKTVNSIESQ